MRHHDNIRPGSSATWDGATLVVMCIICAPLILAFLVFYAPLWLGYAALQKVLDWVSASKEQDLGI